MKPWCQVHVITRNWLVFSLGKFDRARVTTWQASSEICWNYMINTNYDTRWGTHQPENYIMERKGESQLFVIHVPLVLAHSMTAAVIWMHQGLVALRETGKTLLWSDFQWSTLGTWVHPYRHATFTRLFSIILVCRTVSYLTILLILSIGAKKCRLPHLHKITNTFNWKLH